MKTLILACLTTAAIIALSACTTAEDRHESSVHHITTTSTK